MEPFKEHHQPDCPYTDSTWGSVNKFSGIRNLIPVVFLPYTGVFSHILHQVEKLPRRIVRLEYNALPHLLKTKRELPTWSWGLPVPVPSVESWYKGNKHFILSTQPVGANCINVARSLCSLYWGWFGNSRLWSGGHVFPGRSPLSAMSTNWWPGNIFSSRFKIRAQWQTVKLFMT